MLVLEEGAGKRCSECGVLSDALGGKDRTVAANDDHHFR